MRQLIENEYEYLSKKYVEADWTMASSQSEGICIGKICNKIIVNILYPSRQFILNTEIMNIIKDRHPFNGKTKWLIENSSVLMSLDDNKNELGKIISFLAQNLKHYYIEQKKEEIYAAKDNYKNIQACVCY